MQVAGVSVTPETIMTVGEIPPEEVAALGVAAVNGASLADSLWIPCTAIQTMEAIAAIEDRSGKPVVSGSQALMWAALRGLGIMDPIPLAGRLLA